MSFWDKIKILITGDTEFAANTVGTLYAVAPNNATADQTVVRSLNTATRVNSAGNIETVVANKARIDFSLGVDQCPNLLVEKAHANEILESNTLTVGAIWANTAITLTSGQVSPTVAGNEGWKLDKTTVGDNLIYNATNPSSTAQKTVSFRILKDNDETRFPEFFFRLNLGEVEQYVQLNTKTGVIAVRASTGVVSQSIRSDSTGNWWILTLTCAATTAIGIDNRVGIRPAVSSILGGFDTATLGSVIIWNPQSHIGAVDLSPVTTVATAVTANADVISKTGLSALIPQTKGCIAFDGYLQAGSLADSTVRTALYVTDGGNDNFFQFYRNNNNIAVVVRVGGVLVSSPIIPIISPLKNKRIKLVLKYELNNVVFYVNGSVVDIDLSSLIPTCSVIWIGKENGTYWDGLIKAVAVTDELTISDIDQFSQYATLEEAASEMVYTYES